MRKIIWMGIFVAILLGIFFGANIKQVNACSTWCDPVCRLGSELDDGSCGEWVTQCGDRINGCLGGQGGWSCDPGYYACNRDTGSGVGLGCCPIGDGGVGGGNGGVCTGRTDNCPTGWAPAPNMLQSGIDPNPYCRRPTYCPGVGTAQIQTGCCNYDYTDPDYPEGICITPQFKTVSCCPPMTAEGYVDTVSTDYTYTHSCHDPGNTGLGGVCQNPTDIWKSDGRDTSSLCYVAVNNCSYDKDDNPYDCEYTNIYNFSTTCTRVTRTYSCISTCNVTPPVSILTSAGPTIGTSINIDWTIGANGWGQLFWVDEDLSEVNNGCPTAGDCEASRFLTASDNSEQVTGLQPSTTYYYRIVTYQTDACQKDVGGGFTTPASSGAISGIVYLDASNTCDETSTLNNVDVVLDGVTTDNSGPAGAFSFTGLALNSSHSLAVSLANGYICSTSPACSAYPCTVSGVVSPDSSRRFYLTQNQGSWWQAEGATIYAGGSTGVTVGSTIPASIPDLDRYLIVEGALGSLSSGSILRSSATAASLGAGGASVEGYQARSIYRGDRANYSYFKNEMGLLTTTDSLLNLDSKPIDGAAFHYISSPASMNNVWTVGATDKLVIFVNGNLDINADITVAPGGFAAFIVNGSINVSPDVENLQGMFVANQNFNTVSNGTVDTQLTVEGSVVAWGDVSLDRDLVTNNSNSPAEKFVYRPDLLISMPDEMKSFVMQWSEVVPGTYDE